MYTNTYVYLRVKLAPLSNLSLGILIYVYVCTIERIPRNCDRKVFNLGNTKDEELIIYEDQSAGKVSR